MNERIAITGAGIISALGTGREATRRALLAGSTPLSGASLRGEAPEGRVGLTDDELAAAAGVAPGAHSRSELLGIVAMREALAGAWPEGMPEGVRVAVVNGTTVAGMTLTESRWTALKASPEAGALAHHSCGDCTDAIIGACGLRPVIAATISTACSSAANALLVGARLLAEGKADVAIAGGTEALSEFHRRGFASLMNVDSAPCRPFSAERAGLNLGEGAAWLVLERGGDALERGAAISGWLAGGANACDAFHQTATSAEATGAAKAMREALESAGYPEIDYINAHGTGTPDNDRAELHAIAATFGDAPRRPAFSSTKSRTGHTTSASGAIEAVIVLEALAAGVAPANRPCPQPMEEEGFGPLLEEMPLRAGATVMSNSFGFGGNDTSIIISGAGSASAFAGPEASAFDLAGPEGKAFASAGSGYRAEVCARCVVEGDAPADRLRRYVKPMESRRMGRMLKGVLLSALTALEEGGVDCPDAIIGATDMGCWEATEQCLDAIAGGEPMSPTLFMQSTHNTPTSAVAIRVGCHGYNTTYSHGRASAALAEADARSLIAAGKARTVLVVEFDESTPLLRALYPGAPEQTRCVAALYRRCDD